MNQSPASTNSLGEPAAPRPLRLIAACCLLVLTAASACSVGLINQGPTKLPTTGGNTAIVCVAPSRPSPAGGCIVRDPTTGISLRVANAYADASSTVVELETANSDNYPLSISDPQVALKSGRVLQGFGGGSGALGTLVVAEPVPPDAFGPQVQYVATAHFMYTLLPVLNPPTPPPAPPWLGNLNKITVNVPFEIPAVRSGGYSYHQAPIVKQGIGVRVQSLDYSSSHTAFYGAAGGARLELLFSGLPADMELLSFIDLQASDSINIGGATSTVAYSGPGLLQLHIPGMTVSTPEFTLLQNPQSPPNSQETSEELTIGSAGTVQLEVGYQGSGVPSGQPATLSISRIQLLTGGTDGSSGNVPVLPTYQITLPLS